MCMSRLRDWITYVTVLDSCRSRHAPDDRVPGCSLRSFSCQSQLSNNDHVEYYSIVRDILLCYIVSHYLW